MSALSELLLQANAEGLSYQRIEDRARERGAQLSHGTAHKYMTGQHPPRAARDVLRAFTVVFPSLTMKALEAAADLPTDLGNYVPPAEANALTRKEREALNVLIRSIAQGRGMSRAALAVVPTFPDANVYDRTAADEQKESGGQDEPESP
jgi:hypothetical protein